MNRRQIVTRSLIAVGILAYLPNIIHILHFPKVVREHKRQHTLDLQAIERTRVEMVERAWNGEFNGMSGDELDKRFYEQLDFNKIAVRTDI